ncbi:MAG: beta-ketoacyl-ACP synthase II [Anaerolineales bacterium]|nr:beta-ketoacyl-ACP synthase II [Anaerolineales bacterium]
MRKRVVVTGLGCISPLALNWPETWQALVAGRSGVTSITQFDASQFKTKIAAEVKGFDPNALFGPREARRMDRVTQFALACAGEAIQQAGLDPEQIARDRVGVVIGTGIGGIHTMVENWEVLEERGPDRVSPFMVPMMLADTPAGMIAIRYGFRGPNMAVVTACATGSNAIGEAAEMVRRGAADVILTGGTEASIIPVAIAGMSVVGALSSRNADPAGASRPFDKDRDGFIMGEGAAVLVLESLEHAQARRAAILAEFNGYGTSADAFHVSAPETSGQALSIQRALTDAALSPEAISYINAHGTSTYLNDKSETQAIKAIFGEAAYRVAISSTKSMTGHLLGASGALEAAVSVQAIQDNLLPPTINYTTPDPECDLDYVPNQARDAEVGHVMSNSFGFGGHNATLIMSRFEE